jgi:ABC-type branched-subunit amino acid transport system ATPase component
MDLAFSIADHITVLNFGEKVFEGTPEDTRGNPTVRQIYLGGGDETYGASNDHA